VCVKKEEKVRDRKSEGRRLKERLEGEGVESRLLSLCAKTLSSFSISLSL
jgi:hypothetical protein